MNELRQWNVRTLFKIKSNIMNRGKKNYVQLKKNNKIIIIIKQNIKKSSDIKWKKQN